MPNHPQMSELADEHGMDLHYGREDKPHVHEWYIAASINDRGDAWAYAWCDCGAKLGDAAIMRSINATERLSASFAEEIAMGIEESGGLGLLTSDAPTLYAYASALKGKAPTP